MSFWKIIYFDIKYKYFIFMSILSHNNKKSVFGYLKYTIKKLIVKICSLKSYKYL